MRQALAYDEATVGGDVAHAEAQLREAGIDDARLEAEVMLAHALGIDRTRLLARVSESIDDEARWLFGTLAARRLSHEPLAYIVGHREFYGIDFECAAGALIPRPESEMLVDAALVEIRARGDASRVVDVGTGSGAIAVALALGAPGAGIVGIDVSADALGLARRNATAHDVGERIEFRKGDLLEGAGGFDVIVANLPYVSEAEWRELAPEIREYEPREALVGGERGTEIIERLIAEAPKHLGPGGLLACEIGAMQGDRLRASARGAFPSGAVDVRADLAGLDRVLIVWRP